MKRILKTLAMMAVMLSLAVVPAVAQSELDQSQPIFNRSWAIQEEHVKQTFTAQKTGTLDTVELHVECFSLCASFNNGGIPTLMLVTINGTGVTDVHGDPPRGGEFLGDNASSWYTIPIYPAPFVQAGQQYEIEVWLANFSGHSTLLHGADSDVYPGGEFFYQDRYWDGVNWVTDWKTPSASTNGDFFHDLAFRTYVTPDTTAPTVDSVNPAGGAISVPRRTSLTAHFSEAVEASTLADLTSTNVQLFSGNSTKATKATLNWNPTTNPTSVTLIPSTKLDAKTRYTAKIRGGATGVTDVAGNPLASDFSWSFTTGSM